MPVDGASLAVKVRMEVAVPPPGIVIGVGRLIMTPSGATPVQAADRLTTELNPFTDENTTVVDLETSGVRLTTEGEGWVTKSGPGVERIVPAGVTTSCNAAACAKPLGLVPMMLRGYVPGATESST